MSEIKCLKYTFEKDNGRIKDGNTIKLIIFNK